MSLQPLLDASPIIQLHAYAATLAFLIGGMVLFRRKGDRAHKRWGMSWVGLMVIVVLTSFFIWELRVFGLFSPIHILSVVTLVSLFHAVQQARKRNIKAHMRTMQALYLLALVLTGWFTFMPGRIMNRVVFGEAGAGPFESAVFLLSSLAVGAGAIWLVRRAGGKRLLPATR